MSSKSKQKPLRFRDIPKLTKCSGYSVDVSWNYLEKMLDGYREYPNGLDLDPDFQRGHVWTEDQQRAYVEFCLMGGRGSKTLLFNSVNFNRGSAEPEVIELVDGKQRLTAVLRFLHNELPVFGGHYYRDYTDRLDTFDATFHFMINDLPTREAVLKWYLELNDGGTPHTKEEIDKVKKMLAMSTEK